MATDVTSYKQLKEDFVSNLTGGSIAEINYVTAVAPVALTLWSILQARQSFFKPYGPLSFVVDLVINVFGPLLSITLYSHSPLLLCVLLVAPAILVYALPPNPLAIKKKPRLPPAAQSQNKPSDGSSTLSRKPFLTMYRGSLMILTCLAILAVDFKIFPRRFAKVETWGTSLMDLGVGSFVFSAGIVGARPLLKAKAERRAISLRQGVAASLRHSLPLLAMGVVRLVSVKGLDYAEHVTEYGVHWNFFFTLALLPPFVAIFQSISERIPSFAALAIILGVSYQYVLETSPLKAYVLSAPRTDLLSMNREGICSFVGYLAIYLAGHDMGMVLLPRKMDPKSEEKPNTQRINLLLEIGGAAAGWMVFYFITTDYTYGTGLSVSRRLANLPYIVWVAAFNATHIFVFCLIESIFFPAFYNASDAKAEEEAYQTATSRVIRAFNRNGLALFLLANLLTGLVNMTVPTLDVKQEQAMGILVGYASVLSLVAVVLDHWNISLKI
ncbi:GPI-anchored wall transfer protein 1 [Xylariaceae sp. FL0594]|nr:GPI-anchored wall transfer protein 1 [Xylariaceae sp. FL0594]